MEGGEHSKWRLICCGNNQSQIFLTQRKSQGGPNDPQSYHLVQVSILVMMVRHFQEEEGSPALPDLPKAVKVAANGGNIG